MSILYNVLTILKRAIFPYMKNCGQKFAGIGQIREEISNVNRYIIERPGRRRLHNTSFFRKDAERHEEALLPLPVPDSAPVPLRPGPGRH